MSGNTGNTVTNSFINRKMSVLPFDAIVEKLDKWNAQRLAGLNGRPESVTPSNDEQKFIDRLAKAEKIQVVESKKVEREDRTNMKPLHSSTPLVLSPNSIIGRHQNTSRAISEHSVISTISKCTSTHVNGRKESALQLVSTNKAPKSELNRDKNENLPFDLSSAEDSRRQDSLMSERTELSYADSLPVIVSNSDDAIFQDAIRRLTNAISVQENQMAQASAALNRFHEDGRFGTIQELGIQRVLLLANARWKALNQEINRVKTSFLINQILPIKNDKNQISFIYIHYMKFLLNRNYCVKTNQRDDLWAYVVVCKHNEQVFATQVTTVIDMGTLRDRMVSIRDLIRFESLPPDFQVLIEIYGVTSDKDKNRNCIMSFTERAKAILKGCTFFILVYSCLGSPKNSAKKKKDFTQLEAHGLEFRLCGYLHVNRDCFGVNKLTVQEAVYPLDGICEIKITSSQ